MRATLCWISAIGTVLVAACGGETVGGAGQGSGTAVGTAAPSMGTNAPAAMGGGGTAPGPAEPPAYGAYGAASSGGQAGSPSVVSEEAGTEPVVVNPSSLPPSPPPPSQAQLVTLASGHTCPWGMAIDATSVYWTDCGDPDLGHVQKVSKAGGVVVPLASGNRLSGIAVDSTNVYWVAGTADASSGAIMVVPVAGGTPTVLAPESGEPAHIAVDASFVYWGDMSPNGGILKASLAGGSPLMVAPAVAPFQIALSDTAVFWLGPQGLMTAPKTGGAAVALTRPGPTIPNNGLAVNSTAVYFTGGLPGTPGVSEVPLGGGAVVVVSQSASSSFGGGPIAVDATRAYWADISGSVYAAPLSGGSAIVLATGQDNVDAIAVDDDAVYWLVNGNGSPGGVMKLPLSAIAMP
jgi:hypothetical protein